MNKWVYVVGTDGVNFGYRHFALTPQNDAEAQQLKAGDYDYSEDVEKEARSQHWDMWEELPNTSSNRNKIKKFIKELSGKLDDAVIVNFPADGTLGLYLVKKDSNYDSFASRRSLEEWQVLQFPKGSKDLMNVLKKLLYHMESHK